MLLDALAEVQAKKVVLISTIDDLPAGPGLDESFDPHGDHNRKRSGGETPLCGTACLTAYR